MKSNRFIYIGIVILLIAIFILLQVKFKFFTKPNSSDSFQIDDIENVFIKDLNGSDLKLPELLSKTEVTFCLIFELSNCSSCILNGLEDLKKLQDEGTQCIALIVHDNVDEIAGWSVHQDFTPFFEIKKRDFYEYIQSAILPVIVKFKNGKVIKYRYITI